MLSESACEAAAEIECALWTREPPTRRTFRIPPPGCRRVRSSLGMYASRGLQHPVKSSDDAEVEGPVLQPAKAHRPSAHRSSIKSSQSDGSRTLNACRIKSVRSLFATRDATCGSLDRPEGVTTGEASRSTRASFNPRVEGAVAAAALVKVDNVKRSNKAVVSRRAASFGVSSGGVP